MNRKEKVENFIFHAFSAVLIAFSIYFALSYFTPFARLWQALKDLGNACVYYVHGFSNTQGTVHSTVQFLPSGAATSLPITTAEAKEAGQRFLELFIDPNNFSAYMSLVGRVLSGVALAVLALILPLTVLFLLGWAWYAIPDNQTGKKSIFLKGWFWLEDIFYLPFKRFFVGYAGFLRARGKWYILTFSLLWAWNLNAFTIVFEFIAFVLWVGWSRRFDNILVQIAKLYLDLRPTIAFIPLPLWIVFGYLIFNAIRRHIGFERLKDGEALNKKFLLDHPGNLLATGKPRVGKTQTITDMTISQEISFREIAQEKSLARRMEFPFFEWGVLEQSILKMRDRIWNFSLTFIREWFADMEWHFMGRRIFDPVTQKLALARFKRWGYQGNDFIFNYDYKRHGTEYDNELSIVNVFESIELYAEEFYIYTHPSPLVFGNYPIRTDVGWKTYGNYPIMKADLFKRKARDRAKWSQFIHIVNHDGLRLGKKLNPYGIYNDAYDLGCLTLSELGKELGNQNTNRGERAAGECNPNNDLWTLNAKMYSHASTIDFFTYFRILCDEQRAMSILADFREIGNEMPILKKHDPKIKLPFFAFEELLFVISQKIMKKLVLFFSSRHGKMTLFFYIALRLYSVLFNHRMRVFNRFSSEKLDLKVVDQSNGEAQKSSKICHYELARIKICSDRYNTGFFNTFYKAKFKRSRVGGLHNTPQFTGLDPTIPQMRGMESRFNEEIFKHFGIAA